MNQRIRALWTHERGRIDREARESRDSQAALFELSELYDRLDVEERQQVDELLGDWVVSDDEGLRFDALALIREKRILGALSALDRLLVTLHQSRSPGAPYEADKVRSVITRLRGDR